MNNDDERVLDRLRAMKEVELFERIIPAFLEATGATHITLVHGPFERGKDYIYLAPNRFGRNELEVCQVKNQPFTGRATDTVPRLL